MTSEFHSYILELLEPSGGISSQRMFGGYVVRKYGVPIALIIQDKIYLKVDDTNRPDFEAMGSKPFSYRKKGKTITISNWEVPIEILEDTEALMLWIEKAYKVACKAKK